MPRTLSLLLAFGCAVGSVAFGQLPSQVGQWETPRNWPVIAIHAALLPNGKVLHYAYPNSLPGSNSQVWDVAQGEFEPTFVDSDLFCSGLILLPDGTLYVTGGNDYDCEFQGRRDTHRFDPTTQIWTPLADMSVGRWYPTNIMLGDGRIIIVSGLGLDCQTTPVMEMYTPGVGLQVVPEGAGYLPLFPRLHLLTSGRIAYVGPGSDTYTFDPVGLTWEYITNSNRGWRGSGTSVLLPGAPDRIMIIGGEQDDIETATTEVIDFSQPVPQWQPGPTLNHARAHANPVILPDGRILLVGGGTDGLYHDPVLIPEMFDPATGVWTALPPHVHGRMYHSTAVLLPDGRVLLAGQDYGASSESGELYSPSYLFQAGRPTLGAAPSQITYGTTFTLTTPDAASIAAVVLIPPTVTTHSVNMSQRHVSLGFVQTGPTTLQVVAPPSGNHAPPGYYMLFLLDDQRVPSVAPFVQLLEDTAGCADLAACADTNGNAVRDDICTWWDCSDDACTPTPIPFGDIGGAFGGCPPDGFVNIHDRNHALRCFEGTSACEALNLDSGGPFLDCAPDGFCNVHDANMALTVFAGTSTCSCGPAPEDSATGPARWRTRLTLASNSAAVAAGDLFRVTVRLTDALANLQSYQLQVQPSGGSAGSLELLGVEFPVGRDAALPATRPRFTAVNESAMQLLAGLDDAGVATPSGAELATLVLRTSPDASGTFVIDIAATAEDPTWLIAGFNEAIAISSTTPAVVDVYRRRARRDRGTVRQAREVIPFLGRIVETGNEQLEAGPVVPGHLHHDHGDHPH